MDGYPSTNQAISLIYLIISYPYQSTLHSSSCASLNRQLCFASIASNIASVTSVLFVSPNFLCSSEDSFSNAGLCCIALKKVSFFVSWYIMHVLKESVRADLFQLSRFSNIKNHVIHENNLSMQLSIIKVTRMSRMVFGMKRRARLSFSSQGQRFMHLYGFVWFFLAQQKGFLKTSYPSIKNHNAGEVTCLKLYC